MQSGLLLSEVLKEREAQIAFKAKRQNMYKDLDNAYAIYQEEAREKGKLADMISAQERAKEVAKISSFQLEQYVILVYYMYNVSLIVSNIEYQKMLLPRRKKENVNLKNKQLLKKKHRNGRKKRKLKREKNLKIKPHYARS